MIGHGHSLVNGIFRFKNYVAADLMNFSVRPSTAKYATTSLPLMLRGSFTAR